MGAKSDRVRYNTELASLLLLTGGTLKNFDPTSPDFDPSEHFKARKLRDSKAVYAEIMKFLPPSYDKKTFDMYYNVSVRDKPKIEKAVGKIGKVHWVGGSNLTGSDANPADVDFVGHDAFGISIKDSGGITLANLTPKILGLSTEHGIGTIITYSNIVKDNGKSYNLYALFKRKVFLKVIAKMKTTKKRLYPNPKRKEFFIENYGKDEYLIGYKTSSGVKKEVVMTRQQIFSQINWKKNIDWHRPFGEYLIQNEREFRTWTTPYYNHVAENMIEIMKTNLAKPSIIHRSLNMGKKPYIYQTPKKLYYVPAISDLGGGIYLKDLKLKSDKKGAGGLQFMGFVGTKESKETAVFELHIRYANGMFAANPTVRIQSIKNMEAILWQKL